MGCLIIGHVIISYMEKLNKTCAYCSKPILVTKRNLKENNYCGVGCFNRKNKLKPISGYKQCLFCSAPFPYRNSLLVRSAYCERLKQIVGSLNQKFCTKKCAFKYHNKYQNPSQTPSGRKRISEYAKSRDKSFLHTKEARKNLSIAISGKEHWNWQGGKTAESRLLRSRIEAKDWRKTIYERDNYTCQECGARSGNGKTIKLNADHIKPWSLFPELRFELNNGRTLCVESHKKTDTYMGR